MGSPNTKKSLVNELLDQGMILVTLDATAAGVDVPPHLRRDEQLRLNLSYRFGLPMDVGNEGIEATLTFAGVPYDCRLPWHAVYLIVSHVTGRPVLFPEDVPETLLKNLSQEQSSLEDAGLVDSPKLEIISGEQEENPDPPAPSPTQNKGRGHLRVVK